MFTKFSNLRFLVALALLVGLTGCTTMGYGGYYSSYETGGGYYAYPSSGVYPSYYYCSGYQTYNCLGTGYVQPYPIVVYPRHDHNREHYSHRNYHGRYPSHGNWHGQVNHSHHFGHRSSSRPFIHRQSSSSHGARPSVKRP